MRVVHVIPGSGGGFYCENCAREAALLPAMRERGVEVLAAPLYLPLALDGSDDPGRRLFFGAVNVYLQEKLPLFRATPRAIDRVFDSPRLLRWAAARAGSTSAGGLEDMTLSMLRGEKGRQAKELDRLVRWLAAEARPDVVHLSNALLLGLAHRVRRDARARVVCTLQDEEGWVDAMAEPGRSAVWEAMASQAAAVDLFTSVSRSYAERMGARLGLDPGRVRVVPPGIDPEGFEPASAPPEPPAAAYLSRLGPGLGLDLLAGAVVRLRRDPRLAGLRLRAAGGWLSSDVPFLDRVRESLRAGGALGAFEASGPLARPDRARFLRAASVLSVPAPAGSAFGMFLLEAMAAGVPVVQPRSGAYPEVIEASGAGLLCEPGDAESLAKALERVLLDPGLARELGARGREAVRGPFHARRMAADMVRVYEEAMEVRT
ncbi:MAG: glycosyltransferase family 4 protein [Planctomycetes bacterium]|jgi:glycosyltransferase involved in cell wall biosynthesis|nr:glycosyltransferase family 4 protein [Planctomycetota bacterium]